MKSPWEPLDRRARPLLGTIVELGLRGGGPEVFSAAFERIGFVHDLMSAHSIDSDLGRIASEAHLRAVTVDPATAEVLRLSLEWAEASSGAFDPVRAGVELVHLGRRPWFLAEFPDRLATWRDLSVEGVRVTAARPLAIDLGGIAKGYAVDLAAGVIAASGCSGVVNAGGDIRFIGDELRTVFLKRPDEEGGLSELREIPFPALATTASYGFSEEEGNFDLVDPLTRKPPSSGFSITVFADCCTLADAMTKAVMNLPEDQAADLLKRFGCSALILKSGGKFRELP